MKVVIHPSRLGGTLRVPASKSVMQRACAAALLSQGKTLLMNPGRSADDLVAVSVIAALGATIASSGDQLLIESKGLSTHKPIIVDCGESGLSIRMFTPIVSCLSHPVTLTGSGSLVNRPMHFFDSVLPLLGVEVCTTDGKLPIGIQGPLRPCDLTIDASISSQFLTGLLFAFAAAGASDVTIRAEGLVSKPYIDLTLSVLASFGLPCPENRDYREFYYAAKLTSFNKALLKGSTSSENITSTGSVTSFGASTLVDRVFTVEADWSSASFLLVAGALTGSLRLQGLDLASNQADRAILNAFDAAQVGYAIDAKGLVVHPSEIMPFVFDATDCPDLFPPLVSLAAFAQGETVIKGAHRLVHKESNRAQSLQQEFEKMGVVVIAQNDALVVRGTGAVKGANVSACADHRIAMALAVAALRAEGTTEIAGAEAIQKSYPGFFADLSMLGAFVSLPDFN